VVKRAIALAKLQTCALSQAYEKMEEASQTERWVRKNAADHDAIRSQLERMLEDPLFRNSKRYPRFLRFVVEQSLAGKQSLLKEHSLGVEVFHRAPDYSPSQDTVVRLTASEVRKRIALYYQQPQHAGELRIDLRPGSYIPLFYSIESPSDRSQASAQEEFGGRSAETDGTGDVQVSEQQPSAAKERGSLKSAARRIPLRPRVLWLAGVVTVLALVTGFLIWRYAEKVQYSAEHQLWAPILDGRADVTVVIPDLSQFVTSVAGKEPEQQGELALLMKTGELVGYRDVLAGSKIAIFLAEHHKSVVLKLSTEANYPDLQRGASILVGGVSNTWSIRVMAPLPYRLVVQQNGDRFIEDSGHPDRVRWGPAPRYPSGQTTEDFGLVARIFDQTTGQPVLIVAGLGANGTTAAGEFVQDPARAGELTLHAPRDWRHLNMEAVIRTQVFDNHSGPPHLVVCRFW